MEFWETLQALESNPKVLELKNYAHHKVGRFWHSHNVAVFSFYLSRRWDWKVDMKTLATGAMLHDYYFYERKESGMSDYEHAIQHPKIALYNAQRDFSLNEKEKNIILSHMWPFPFSAMPECREAVLVGMADKYCAYQEMKNGVVHIESILERKASV